MIRKMMVVQKEVILNQLVNEHLLVVQMKAKHLRLFRLKKLKNNRVRFLLQMKMQHKFLRDKIQQILGYLHLKNLQRLWIWLKMRLEVQVLFLVLQILQRLHVYNQKMHRHGKVVQVQLLVQHLQISLCRRLKIHLNL